MYICFHGDILGKKPEQFGKPIIIVDLKGLSKCCGKSG